MKLNNKSTRKKSFLAGLFCFMLVLIGTFAQFPLEQVNAAAVTPTAGNIYYIKNKHSGLYLTVNNDSSSNGANVIQSKGTGSLGQKWILEQNKDGSYRFHPATDMTGGVSLDVSNGSTAGGTNIQIWSKNGCSAQNFKIEPSSDGYAITTAVTNYASCLDVLNFSTSSGANVIQWTNNNTNNQVWYFENASWPSSGSTGSTGSSNTGSTISFDTDYSNQRIQLESCNNGKFVTAPSSTGNTTAVSTSSQYNQWILKNNGSNKYLIVNTKSGYVLAPSNNNATNGATVVTTGYTGDTSQYWTFTGAKTDANGDSLSYRIANCKNTSFCLQLSGNGFILGTYKGSSTHRFFVNSYGAEGFAGHCTNVNGKEKASVTGGLFGKVVYASDFNTLSSYCSGDTAYTIIVNNNISKSSLTKIYVGKNKTIIGSFSKNTLTNVHFRCTSDSGNVIFKNLTFKHDADKNENDDIQLYISNGNNFWIDHCTFPGHSISSTDVDKFVYVGLKADYVSITGSVFMNHKYGLILGYPQDNGSGTYTGYPQMTICNNYFYGVLTRAPGLMRYGYFHCYNNFVYDFNLGYTPYTDCTIYSENNYFDAGNHTGAVVDDHGVGKFSDSGSVLSWDLSNLKTSSCSWRPMGCYKYSLRTASSAKTWAQNYAGVKSQALTYAID